MWVWPCDFQHGCLHEAGDLNREGDARRPSVGAGLLPRLDQRALLDDFNGATEIPGSSTI